VTPVYQGRWPVGARIRIADSATLGTFLREWHYHNPLHPEQLAHAGRDSTVESVGFYHGGDPLYVLESLPGVVWHECCLEDARPEVDRSPVR